MTAASASLYPFDYEPERHLLAKARRRLVQWSTVAPLGELNASIITFSFDDFPKSAVDNGADILHEIDAKAIYYACSGLSGKSNKTGEQYEAQEIQQLIDAGHEIGAHTHFHKDCAVHPVSEVLTDIDRNLQSLKDMGVAYPIRHFAYPYGETSLPLKKALADKFDTARGILRGHNFAHSDKMQLRAMELTPDPMTIDRAINAINQAQRAPCWLHIFTHDIRSNPSDFGVNRNSFLRVARAARNSGLPILPPTEALERLKGMDT